MKSLLIDCAEINVERYIILLTKRWPFHCEMIPYKIHGSKWFPRGYNKICSDTKYVWILSVSEKPLPEAFRWPQRPKWSQESSPPSNWWKQIKSWSGELWWETAHFNIGPLCFVFLNWNMNSIEWLICLTELYSSVVSKQKRAECISF